MGIFESGGVRVGAGITQFPMIELIQRASMGHPTPGTWRGRWSDVLQGSLVSPNRAIRKKSPRSPPIGFRLFSRPVEPSKTANPAH